MLVGGWMSPSEGIIPGTIRMCWLSSHLPSKRSSEENQGDFFIEFYVITLLPPLNYHLGLYLATYFLRVTLSQRD